MTPGAYSVVYQNVGRSIAQPELAERSRSGVAVHEGAADLSPSCGAEEKPGSAVSFNMSRGTLNTAKPLCVFAVAYNGEPVRDDLGKVVEFATHEAAETYADEIAAKMNTARECFSVRREWL
jgi:hypothetical protein